MRGMAIAAHTESTPHTQQARCGAAEQPSHVFVSAPAVNAWFIGVATQQKPAIADGVNVLSGDG